VFPCDLLAYGALSHLIRTGTLSFFQIDSFETALMKHATSLSNHCRLAKIIMVVDSEKSGLSVFIHGANEAAATGSVPGFTGKPR